MSSSSLHTIPPFFLFLLLLLAVLIALAKIGILGYAYEKMGISRGIAYALLLASLLGSAINIPIAEISQGETAKMKEVVDNWGVHYVVPVLNQWPKTILAVNLGGAIIPTALSIYLIVKNQIYFEAILGIVIVAIVVHALAKPIPQMGIAVPIFIPPIAAALVAMILSREYAAPLAYTAGCLGTLVGADILNLPVITRMGASVASIGGAGTFDGVFLTGIFAVLLAARPRPTRPPAHEQEQLAHEHVSG